MQISKDKTNTSSRGMWVKDAYGIFACDKCGERALYEKHYSMDGESMTRKLSNYCPSCRIPMTNAEDSNISGW